ncbi:MAG TPA: thioredoxin domain-containing protein [Longimicrobiales bacterium]|nr:thioredoxin domain-containing protein [Longimicrobiales bacterium]
MANALQGSRSPFLQHGAHQPVDWMPWGDAAFARAKKEDRPILLDIGAVWCHWCHVMDRESYEDPQTAALINQFIIPVKVDRDESPDVDARYQRAVQTMTGQGGWPLTAFLTPDGEVYYGGTYFPPTDAHGRPSFKRVIVEVARVYRDERDKVHEAVNGIRERLKNYSAAETESGNVSPDIIKNTVEELAEAFDFRFGGFGRAPKFPNPGALMLLLDHHIDSGADWSRRMIVETLNAMARGGIYDQLGGGFHRYATDARWLVPHFEKMAYDNGPLLEVYAAAFAKTGSDLYREIVHGIISHYDDVAADVVANGGFPASQDADYSPNDDGDYWTWTPQEIEAVLGTEEAPKAAAYFGLNDAGSEMHLDPSRHVLFRAGGDEVNEDWRSKLKTARDARPQPFVDKTVYAGWSALVASGHFAAARYCSDANAGQKALRALERIWNEAFGEKHGIAHRVGDRDAGAFLDDQAYVLAATIDAFELTQDKLWLGRALQLNQLTTQWYRDENGAYRDRPRRAPAVAAVLSEPHYPIADAPTPSGNGVMALNLMRLALLQSDDELRADAAAVITSFGASAPRMSTAVATYVRAVAWLTQPATSIVIVGRKEAREEPLFQSALRTYRPRTVLRYLRADADPTNLPPEQRGMLTSTIPAAYLCVGNTCERITDADTR